MTIEAQLTDLGSRAAPRKGRRLRAFRRNPAFVAGTLILVFFVLVAIFADFISPYDPQDLVAQPAMWPGEDLAYPLGTDSLGRDVLTNLIHGTRASLLVGISAAAIGLAIGMIVGSLAGFFGGWVDTFLMRLVELFQTTPTFLLVIVILAIMFVIAVWVMYDKAVLVGRADKDNRRLLAAFRDSKDVMSVAAQGTAPHASAPQTNFHQVSSDFVAPHYVRFTVNDKPGILAQVTAALKIITTESHVRGILFNIFGGITRCDDVANGIVTSLKASPLSVPLVIRLTGTNEDKARQILNDFGLSATTSMDEAVRMVIEKAQEVGA